MMAGRIESRFWWPLLAATALTTPAWAQSRSGELPPYAPPGMSWTGFYLGAAFGGTAAIEHTNGTNTFSNQVGGQGVLASIYGGYDFQVMPKALVGVLAEGTWASAQTAVSAQAGGANASITSQPDWGFALLARAGILATATTGTTAGRSAAAWKPSSGAPGRPSSSIATRSSAPLRSAMA